MQRALPATTLKAIKDAKVLVVGAGGIGCELLKNLVLSGFVDIEVIDLDTIDVSNLNRQFLFRSKHVGKPKALIARDAVLAMNPTAKISMKAHHANVKTSQFDKKFVKKFTVVMNALDNVSARRHVNRLCLAAGVPLIESGSTGLHGQVTVIMKGLTECYECQPKPTQKQYPICTIRSTPTKPVHCIVWAKALFKLLFGVQEESELFENEEDLEEKSTFMGAVKASPTPPTDTGACIRYALSVFDALFNKEIKKKLGMISYKTLKKKPQVLDFRLVSPRLAKVADAKQEPSADEYAALFKHLQNVQQRLQDDAYLNAGHGELVELFVASVVQMWQTAAHQFPLKAAATGTDPCPLDWDKDIEQHLDVVLAAANLRMVVFNIKPCTRFKVKQIAGNIIAAVATTNAVVAGLQVLQLVQLLSSPPESDPASRVARCRTVYVQEHPMSTGSLLMPIALDKPNKDCFVCSHETKEIHLLIDTTTSTLKRLLDDVIKGEMSFNQPLLETDNCADLYVPPGSGVSAEEVMEAHLPLTLEKIPGGGLKEGTKVYVFDESQGDNEVTLVIHHKADADWDEKKFPGKFELLQQDPTEMDEAVPPTPAAPAAAASAATIASKEKRVREQDGAASNPADPDSDEAPHKRTRLDRP